MPFTELVLPSLKPETAKEAHDAIYNASKSIASGPIFRSSGHILRHNGQDIADEYRVVLGLEWESPEDFHGFANPENPVYQQFIGGLLQYMAARAVPRLFKPENESVRSAPHFEKGVTQIFVGTASKTEVEGAWKSVEEALGGKGWSGWGIEDAEGTFAAVIGWESLEELDAALKNDGVRAAFDKLKGVGGMEEFVAKPRV